MADTGAAGAGQESTQGSQQQGQESAANDQQGQQGGTGQESGTQGQQAAEFDLSTITDPAVKSYVEAQIKQAAEARREAAGYRTKAQEAAARAAEYQQANETAEQKAEREAQEAAQEREALRAENKALKIGGQWTKAASAAKALDADALLALIGGTDKIELDDDGKAANLDALLKDARKDYPWAFARAASADAGEGGEGSQGPAKGTVNDLIRNGGKR